MTLVSESRFRDERPDQSSDPPSPQLSPQPSSKLLPESLPESLLGSAPELPQMACDRTLIQACLAGQTHQFRWLYQRYQQPVRSTLYSLCGGEGLDDLVQEVFLRAWKGLPKFQQTARFSTWLYRIAWNVASDQRRHLAQHRDRLQQWVQAAATEDSASTSGLDLLQVHYQDLVQRGLAQLSLEHRGVLVLHDLEELPQKEVAQILAIPVGTVKSRLFHARTSLRKFLHQEGVQL